ncbi:MAG: dihydrolipoyl dehydrogenase [Clostridiales bacterium]|nr:MAG: dihydrolipoyl dehydrogenase [Clostridiales bacterium]
MKYDVAVIGGGPGGYVAAIRAARLGLRTVLFEEDQVGGVCLNRGCIPTKALLKSSGLCWELRHGEEHGLPACTGPVDFPRTAARRDAVVSRLVSGVQGLLKGSGVEMVRSRAELCENRRIEAAGSVWEAENVILAMGSSPVLPEQTEGKAVSSDALVRADTLPASVVIVGGGVIGVEFADMLAGFGSAVTVVELTDRLLPAADPDVSAAVRAGLEEKGVTVLCGARVTEYRAGEVVCEAEGGTRTLRGETVLVSVGRRPHFSPERLERLGIRCTGGKIQVDSFLRTTAPGIYAIGDIVPGPMLAHKASAEGLTAAEHIAGLERPMRYDRIPQCVYTHPEAAWIAMSETQARELPHVKSFLFPAAYNGKSLAEGSAEGFVRLLADERTGEVLGAQLVCGHASELIGQIAAAMQAEACVEDLADLISPHPSVGECIMEAAAGLLGKGIHSGT